LVQRRHRSQLFLADKFEPVFDADRKDIPLKILAEFNHVDMVTNPKAIAPVVGALHE
jgi:hypothetical protein